MVNTLRPIWGCSNGCLKQVARLPRTHLPYAYLITLCPHIPNVPTYLCEGPQQVATGGAVVLDHLHGSTPDGRGHRVTAMYNATHRPHLKRPNKGIMTEPDGCVF
jgi:hypothetical protein